MIFTTESCFQASYFYHKCLMGYIQTVTKIQVYSIISVILAHPVIHL